MEFQSGQNCVTEVNCMLCCKSQQDGAINAETSCSNAEIPCSKCGDLVLKLQRCRAQKSGDLVLKMQRCRAQNAEASCSKCRDFVLTEMQTRRAQNAETSCSKCGDLVLKMPWARMNLDLEYLRAVLSYLQLCLQLARVLVVRTS